MRDNWSYMSVMFEPYLWPSGRLSDKIGLEALLWEYACITSNERAATFQ